MRPLSPVGLPLPAALLFLVLSCGNTSHADEVKCAVSRVGLDPDHGNLYTASYFGKSAAQVFYTPDSVLTAITFWRGPDPTPNIIDMHLYIIGMDKARPLQPDPQVIILEGPTAILSGVSDTPRAVRFDLVPPLSLPSPGYYAFALKPGTDCSGGFSVMIDSTGSYAGGDAWHITPDFDCIGLGSYQRTAVGDLIFEVEACETAVDAKRTSWGALKRLYR